LAKVAVGRYEREECVDRGVHCDFERHGFDRGMAERVENGLKEWRGDGERSKVGEWPRRAVHCKVFFDAGSR